VLLNADPVLATTEGRAVGRRRIRRHDRVDLDTGAVTFNELNHSFHNVIVIAAGESGALVFDGFDYDVEDNRLNRPSGAHPATLVELKPDGTLDTIHFEVAAVQRLADPGGAEAGLIGRNRVECSR
jgi:hypothetical protein